MIQYLIRLFSRRAPLKRSRWRSLSRLFVLSFFIFILGSFLITFFHSISVFHSNYSGFRSSNTIISLTTTPTRFHYELPFAIHSLLSQTQLPKQIRIYLSPSSIFISQRNLTLSQLKLYLEHLDSSATITKLFDQLVQIRFEEEDYGPATKFLPIIKEFHSKGTTRSKSQAIMICDDDNYYHPYTLATLNEYANEYRNSLIGFRGWRVREDLIWGVPSRYEMNYHIIESHHLSQLYRVGVITANSAYLVRPSFFDSHLYRDFNQAPNDVRRVDDIWLNGQASRRNISRYVVPSCCQHIGVTKTHALEGYFDRNKMTRFWANHHALQWFGQSWEKDLWYKFDGENGPRYYSWLMMFYREWINLVLKLKFIVYFGFV